MEHVATSTSRNNVDSGCTRDYTSEFTAIETFNSKEELIIWAKNVGKENGITIVVLRSDSGKGRKKPRVTLGCERSGKSDGINITRTKKCGCPFRLRGKKVAAGNEWELTVDVGIHNHAAGPPEGGHSFQGRLYQEEKSVVKDRYKTGEKPREILRALKERDKHNKSTDRTIYNEVQSLKRRNKLEDSIEKRRKLTTDDFQKRMDSELRDQSPRFLQIMSKAEEYDYIEKHRPSPTRDNVFDFFLADTSNFELLRAFPTVLIIHTDWYSGWVTVEFAGVTSTNMIFCVATAILSSDSNVCYEWALNSFRHVMDDNGIVMPDIVIFDTSVNDEIVCLIKAINDVFSTAKLLIRTDFIFYDVADFCLDEWISGSSESFTKSWELLVASPTEADFEQHLMQLRTELSGYPVTVEFVIDSLLEPYKERFVAAWTDKVMHFGNTEPPIRYDDCSDDQLSLYIITYFLPYSGIVVIQQTTIDEFWESMHSRNEEIRLEIDNSFLEYLKNEYINDEDGLPLLKELHGAISIHALNMIREQTLLANNEIDDDQSECSCAIKRTHGLPCAHEIAKYKREGRPIPLECINSHWRKFPRLKPLRRIGEPNVQETMKRPRLSEERNTNAHSALSLPGIVESERNLPNDGPSIVPSTQEWQPRDEDSYLLGESWRERTFGSCTCSGDYREHHNYSRQDPDRSE